MIVSDKLVGPAARAAAPSPRWLLTVITAPLIYSLIVPLLLLDLWASSYQQLCFRIYGVERVRRSAYVIVDRHRLPYLNLVGKLNCAFCGYGNGVLAYVREIASRTEQYWCPIKHALRISDPHQRYYEFLEFGDAEGYRTRLAAFRALLNADGDDIPAERGAASWQPEAQERTSP